MKKKEFDRKRKDSKKLMDFIVCFEKRSASASEGSIVDKINSTVSGLESVLTEIDTLEGALVLRKKELANLAKQYDKLLKDATKLKRGVDPKIKDEIKDEIKGNAKGDSEQETKRIPEPSAQVKKKEAKMKKDAEEVNNKEVVLVDVELAKSNEIKKGKK